VIKLHDFSYTMKRYTFLMENSYTVQKTILFEKED
jgi:hypothetical protein